MTDIPHVVRARVKLHLAQTEDQTAQTSARLSELPALSAEGRRLRHRRDRLMVEQEAWAYLLGVMARAGHSDKEVGS
jgi:hypothetical protein